MAPTHLARTGRAACALAGSTTCCLCRPGGAHRVTAVPQKGAGRAAGARLGRRVGLRRVGAGAAVAGAGDGGGRRQRAGAGVRLLALAVVAGRPARVPGRVLGSGAQRVRVRPPSVARRSRVGPRVGGGVGRAARGAAAAARAAPARGGAAAAAAAAQPLRVALALPLPAAPQSRSRQVLPHASAVPAAALLGCIHGSDTLAPIKMLMKRSSVSR